MPQLMLEFSSNIKEKNNLQNLLRDCHSILETTLPTTLQSCKSRAVERDCYCVGDGKTENAFVHVTLKVMPGRSQEILQAVGESVINLLREYFRASLKELNLQITVEILELDRNYFKISS